MVKIGKTTCINLNKKSKTPFSIKQLASSSAAQIAGFTGAYGNVGGVAFLTVYSFVGVHTFFMVIAATSVAALIFVQFLKEPKGHMTKVNEDGTVQHIELS